MTRDAMTPEELATFREMAARVDPAEMLAALARSHVEHGTDVRCPTCHIGAGRYCRDASGAVITHPARVALSAES